MPLQLTPRLRKTLGGNGHLCRAVEAVKSDFVAWFDASTIPFFVDYTNHGTQHLEGVLTTVDELITRPSARLLSAEDAATLTLSVLLHDSAMHLSETGFYDLIRGSSRSNRLPFDDKSWPELWSDFLFAARRWDEQKLEDIFGRDDEGRIRGRVHDPLDAGMDLTDSGKRLIGEFLRWHHARLAHECAVFGVPTTSKKRIELDGIEGHLRDIAGLVARSHGMPIRPCMDYLVDRYEKKDPFGVHATYLMTLLRVSDYLQIQADRAPKIILRFKRVWSTLSTLEHETHQCVKNISITNDDPELITIEALPTTVHQFLRLKEWITGIQRELDDSWAAIGETYGSHFSLNRFGLRFRRIRSNIEKASFQKHAEYVADRIVYSIDNQEILKILVRPLYGNDPKFAVRELLQNALDAVRERVRYQLNYPDPVDVSPRTGDAEDVIIRVSDPSIDGDSLLRINDSGIGMKEDTVKKYFLKAGASFRRSSEWAKEYESNDEQPGPSSTVLRTGKFGIGALASFLLADEVTVKTRHLTSPYGLRFTTRLSTGAVELRKDSELPVGTHVEMRLSPQTRTRLLENDHEAFRWYFGSSPAVRIEIGTACVEQPYCLPADDDSPADWLELPSNDFARVLWTLPGRNRQRLVASNGLKIPFADDLCGFSWAFPFPTVSFSDPDGALPVDLARERISIGELPASFRLALEEDLVRLFLAACLIDGPTAPDPEWSDEVILKSRSGGNVLMCSAEGFCPYDPSCIADIGRTKVIVVGEGIHRVVPRGLTDDAWVVDHAVMNQPDYMFGFDEDQGVHMTHLACQHPTLRIVGIRLLGAHGLEFTDDVASLQKDIGEQVGLPLVRSRSASHFQCISEFGECGPTSFPKEFTDSKGWFKEVPCSALEIYVEPSGVDGEESVVARLWRQIMGRPFIPYNADKRLNDLPNAFRNLERYINAFIAMRPHRRRNRDT